MAKVRLIDKKQGSEYITGTGHLKFSFHFVKMFFLSPGSLRSFFLIKDTGDLLKVYI